MWPLAQLARRFGLGCHHADDATQLYLLLDGKLRCTPETLAEALEW